MTPHKPKSLHQSEMFRIALDYACRPDHPLVKLAEQIPWEMFENQFGELYCPDNGRPGLPIRMMVGLLLLKHTRGLSDEEIVEWWLDSPYAQYFCGETHFQQESQLDTSSLSRFRNRIGESGCELILKSTVTAGMATGALKKSDLKRVTVDTTVQEKAVTYPTDAKLLNRVRERLVKKARAAGLKLRQSYVRVGPKRLFKVNRYAHARQMKRMKREVKKLHTILGRVARDVERKIDQIANPCVQQLAESHLESELELAKRVMTQERTSKNKVYSAHAPEVECISKGKVHKRYEFGVKVGIAVTNRSNFVLGGRAFPGNPYDGHTLSAQLDQVERITGTKPEQVFVDRGYRGHGVTDSQIFISGQKRGVNAQLKRLLKRRQAIEPVIGHLKNDGLLGRNYLKGTEGDQMNAMLSCAGHNMRIILKKIRIICADFLRRLFSCFGLEKTMSFLAFRRYCQSA